MRTAATLLSLVALLPLAMGGCQDDPGPTAPESTTADLARAGNPGHGTVRVTPRTLIDVGDAFRNGTPGWFFFEEGAAGKASGELVRGPEKPPRSVGSAQFVLDDGSGAMSLGTVELRGTRLDAFSRLHYCTYRGSGSAEVAVSLQFSADYDLTDQDDSFQGRLVFEPYLIDGTPDAAPVQADTWQCWDALDGHWWATGSPGNTVAPITDPQSLQTLLSQFPDLGIRNPEPAHFFGALILKAGSGWSGGFDGNADKLVVGVDGRETVYDFDRPRPRGAGR